MNYKKPALVAKSEPKHTFVAGCPAKVACGSAWCKQCERTA